MPVQLRSNRSVIAMIPRIGVGKKFMAVVAISVTAATLLCSCGPSKKEIAEREARRDAEKAKIAELRRALRLQSQERISSGERVPPKVKDPGYWIVDCVSPELPEDAVAVVGTGFGASKHICGNTTGGKEIVAWRKWYCDGSEHFERCVLSRWVDGQPTFGEILTYTLQEGMPGKNITFTFSPYKLK
jgi:hypothetical protein